MVKRNPPNRRGYFLFARPRSAPSYVGPLDLVPGAIVAYGQRAMSNALRGSALYTLRRSSDDTAQTFNSDATTGAAPVAAINTFKGVGDAFYTSWKDGSGNAKATLQATASKQPQWGASVIGSLPSATFDGVDDLLATASAVTLTSAITVFCVAKATDISLGVYMAGMNTEQSIGNDYCSFFRVGSDGAIDCDYWDDDVAHECGASSSAGAASINTDYLFEAVYQFGANALLLNGADVMTANRDFHGAPVGISQVLGLGVDQAGPPFSWLPGSISEFIIWPGALSDADRASVRANIAAYYGITLE